MKLCIFLTAACLLCTSSVYGYSAGAATSACGSMMPSHAGAAGQTSASPVTMSMNATSFDCGHVIRVTLASDAGFKGFLCQSRADVAMSATTGMIYEGMYQNNCPSEYGAITHKNSVLKTMAYFDWVPMGNADNFYFVCTVVTEYNTFWVKMQSPMVTYTGTTDMCSNMDMDDEMSGDYNTASSLVPTLLSLCMSFIMYKLFH